MIIQKRLLGLVMLFLVFGMVGTALAQEVTEMPPTIAPTAEAAPTLGVADRTLTEAQNAVTDLNASIESFNSLLNIVEALSGLLALVVGVGGFFGLRSLLNLKSDLRTELKLELEKDRLPLVAQQNEFAEILSEAKKAPQQFAEIRRQNDRAIRAMTLVQLGEQQMREGNPEAALRTFQEAFALDSTNRATNYYLGELYIMQRDLKQAATHLENAHMNYSSETDPEVAPFVSDELSDEVLSGILFPPATAALAYVYRLTGDKVYKSMGNVNERNKFYGRAVDYYSRALEQDPHVKDINGESVHGMLGALHRQWGHREEAIHHYKEAAKLTPSRSYPFNNLAMIYYGKGDVETATPYFDEAIRLSKQRIDNHPTDYWAYFDLINGHLACARPDEAIKTFNDILPRIGVRGPLESFLNGLQVLARSPRPPEPIIIVNDLITQVQEELNRLDSKNDPAKGAS